MSKRLNDATPEEWDQVAKNTNKLTEYFFMSDNVINRCKITGEEVDIKSMTQVLEQPNNFYFRTQEELVNHLTRNVKGYDNRENIVEYNTYSKPDGTTLTKDEWIATARKREALGSKFEFLGVLGAWKTKPSGIDFSNFVEYREIR